MGHQGCARACGCLAGPAAELLNTGMAVYEAEPGSPLNAGTRAVIVLLLFPKNLMDELLQLLRQNARASTADLARELNCPEPIVAAQIAEMEEAGVILGYQAIVDSQKRAAAIVTALVEVKITPERGGGFDRLANRIARFAEVQSCYLMSGGYDLLVVLEGRTLQELAAFISEKLSTIKGVISTATRFRLKTYKENGVSLLREEKAQRLAVTP